MIKLRHIEISDLENYKYWKLPIHKYHSLNGPYFKKQSEDEINQYIKTIKSKLESNSVYPIPNKKLISDNSNQAIGEVNWYWKSEETLWAEIGVVIFDEQNWGKGIGYIALKLWIQDLFETKKEIVRLGLTTWSGNIGMIKVAQKLQMKREAVYRKARIVNGQYFDSISYGLLKEEWSVKENKRTYESKKDEVILDKLTHSFYNIFTNKNGKTINWDNIYKICIPETIIIKKHHHNQEVYNLESFIKPRKELLSNGTLLEFEEREINGKTKITGTIAQRASTYTKTGVLNGKRFEQFGNKFFQFVKSNNQWKINAVIWEDEL